MSGSENESVGVLKLSKHHSVRISKSQNMKVSELESDERVRTGK